jgi:hypothetical protein
MINVKQLEARHALDGVLQQYKLEFSLYGDYLDELFENLKKSLAHVLQQQRERRDPWGEEEVEKLFADWNAHAKRLCTESQARMHELVTSSTEAVPATQMK